MRIPTKKSNTSTDDNHLIFSLCKDLCMVWITIIIFLLLILFWLFLTPLELRVDTRTPQASLQWFSMGKAIVIYENEKWWLKMRVLFFYKQWDLEKLIFPDKKKKKRITRIQKKRKRGKIKWLRKFATLLRTFRVTKWQIALDTGDNIKTAWLYPLNFFSYTRQHLYINFNDENYLVLNVRNAPWKIVYAFLR
jgi:hypothetical protein